MDLKPQSVIPNEQEKSSNMKNDFSNKKNTKTCKL